MNFKRFRTISLAGALTVGMCMGTSVFAASWVGSGTESNPADAEITAEKKGGKKDKTDFVNAFQKDTSLTVKKITEGDRGDRTKKFSFTINFTKESDCDEDSFASGSMNYEYGKDYPFELSDGESLTFGSIPAGTRYCVTEAGAADGYIPEVVVVENGVESEAVSVGETEALSSTAVNEGGLNLAGEGTNTVTFTDTYEDLAITGGIVDRLLFVLMILTAVGGATVFLLVPVGSGIYAAEERNGKC